MGKQHVQLFAKLGLSSLSQAAVQEFLRVQNMDPESRHVYLKDLDEENGVLDRNALGQLLELKQHSDDKLQEYQRLENEHLSELFQITRGDSQLLADDKAVARDPLS